MVWKVKKLPGRILEPSAGKGDLMGALATRFLYGHLGKSLKAAAGVSGSLIIDIEHTPPVATDASEFAPVAKVIKDLQIQHADISAEVTK